MNSEGKATRLAKIKDGDSVWIIGDGVFLPATVAERLIYESPRLHAALFVYFDNSRPRFPARIDELSDMGLSVKLRMPSIANLPYIYQSHAKNHNNRPPREV